MGWKAVKDHFNIEHIVQIIENKIVIGSGYCSDLAIINMNTGKVVRNETFPTFLKEFYPDLLSAKKNQILDLLAFQDEFESSIPVYTYKDDQIILKYCEKAGYPNVTHDGILMYENTFSVDKDIVVGWAKRDVDLRLERYLERITESEAILEELKEKSSKCLKFKEKLQIEYPISGEETC